MRLNILSINVPAADFPAGPARKGPRCASTAASSVTQQWHDVRRMVIMEKIYALPKLNRWGHRFAVVDPHDSAVFGDGQEDGDPDNVVSCSPYYLTKLEVPHLTVEVLLADGGYEASLHCQTM